MRVFAFITTIPLVFCAGNLRHAGSQEGCAVLVLGLNLSKWPRLESLPCTINISLGTHDSQALDLGCLSFIVKIAAPSTNFPLGLSVDSRGRHRRASWSFVMEFSGIGHGYESGQGLPSRRHSPLTVLSNMLPHRSQYRNLIRAAEHPALSPFP